MNALVIVLSWLLVLSVLILAVADGMALKACRRQSATPGKALSRWLATPGVWTLGILAVVLLGFALWLPTRTGLSLNVAAIRGPARLGRAVLILGSIVLVLGAGGFLFSDPAADEPPKPVRPTRRR